MIEQGTLVAYMSMVTAISVTTNLIYTGIMNKRRDEKVAVVAMKAADVATATEKVRHHLNESDTATTTKLNGIQDTSDKIHTIVNAQKTAMMKKLQDSQFLTLTMAKVLLRQDPKNVELGQAVAAAQALYDENARDLARKEEE